MTPWTKACQVPLSMGFSRQGSWSGLPFPSPGDLPDPGIEPRCPALQANSLLSEAPSIYQIHLFACKTGSPAQERVADPVCKGQTIGPALLTTSGRSERAGQHHDRPAHSTPGQAPRMCTCMYILCTLSPRQVLELSH